MLTKVEALRYELEDRIACVGSRQGYNLGKLAMTSSSDDMLDEALWLLDQAGLSQAGQLKVLELLHELQSTIKGPK